MTSVFNVPNSWVVCLLLGIVFSCHDNFVSGAVPPRTRAFYEKEPIKEAITLEDVLGGSLSGRGFSGQWVEGSDDLIRIFVPSAVVHYNITDGKNSTILNLTDISEHLKEFSNLIFSNDGKYALVEHGRSSLWRYSTLAKYDIFDLESKTFTRLAPEGLSEKESQPALQLVKWSPTGNGIAFVYNYNIYYRRDASPSTTVTQITTDGSEENAVYNGIADWVYEEEMFGGPTALWISPSGKNLAFVRFNDTEVLEFQWPIYGEPGNNETTYPEYRKIRYPKSGSKNPEAVMHVVSLTDTNDTPKRIEYSDTIFEDLHLLGTALWANDSTLVVATLNRVQTSSHWHLCNADDNGRCKKIHTYKPENGWVDMNTPKESSDGTEFIFVRSQPQNSGKSYKHVVKFNANGESTVITSGSLSVENILGWDTSSRTIYFSGSFWNGSVADPSETQIYSVPDHIANNAEPRCITCGARNSHNSLCRDNTVIFSSKYTHFIHRCGGPDVPETTTRKTEDGQAIANPGPTFVSNSGVREALSKKAVPLTKEYEIPVGNDGLVAKARLYFPPNYNESQKYPLLISVYGGPGSQNLHQTYAINWEMSLVSGKNIIFGSIDGRGTAKQSTDHLFTLHRNLGTVEVEDQIAVAKWLTENEPLIDASKTSIWGWSYGGYVTAKVMQTDKENVFKCGISVAPVTSWLYYDTIYTERYMGLPTEEDNYKGYNDSDVNSNVENFRNKQYMLIHGNADDNVHYQQSMILARALEKNDIFFHQLSYPDENHAISGPGMRKHLYHSLERFLFNECYGSFSPQNTVPGSRAAMFSNSLSTLLITCIYLIYRHAF
ncbi:Venom dipeptidyl peptidase 4 [Orchesella cincta]|uniref:Venom dipeptidyl peptidase 4 n=1 Tax=Orchesella cincta TaxID=48709 RepID=A0A1D2MMC3_ORCCI|nr:Venom dipeptidyl peptidase 4 [Orchesella cincta]